MMIKSATAVRKTRGGIMIDVMKVKGILEMLIP